jgi:hypothetical protein
MDAKRRGVLVGLALLVPVGLMGGCAAKPYFPAYRYRLTVEVDTPQGLRTGSSVIEVVSGMVDDGAVVIGVGTRVRGEAVAVDLPGGKVLFALLSKPNSAEGASEYAHDALITKRWSGKDEYLADLNAMLRRRDTAVLPRHIPPAYPSAPPATSYPMLVTFGNIADPKTVAVVDPDNLAASFGRGVKLRRITVQMTDAAVTVGIEKRLGWFGSVHGALVHVPLSDYPPEGTPLPLSATIADFSFKQGH